MRPVSLFGSNCYIRVVLDCWVCNKVVKASSILAEPPNTATNLIPQSMQGSYIPAL